MFLAPVCIFDVVEEGIVFGYSISVKREDKVLANI